MSDTPRTEADFANMLNEAFGRGSIHAELESSEYLSHHLKADEKMTAYRKWRDAKARELAVVTAERDALHTAIVQAVALLNRSPSVAECEQGRTAHDILRRSLINHAALRGKEGA